MKAKILGLLVLISIAFGCRSKNKMTASYKDNSREKEMVKIDSVGSESSKSIQNTETSAFINENKNETSGDVVITGKSDESNPFVFHNVVGRDTIQSISIKGNAEYLINNHFKKAENKKSETKREEFISIIQELSQNAVSKDKNKETDSEISQKTNKITAKGFQAGSWIVITTIVVFLIFIFFTYKYFKK
ncbi:hypothetical protein [Chryseobacterium aquaticum]|uniref:Lipoprotein n=1 Tax=Chryseobacterium aquaticum subsp. greenlandense TaxID=345663 RepID=A0A101CFG8_9FLAO|nr:hypothetical protein [Chryseobacterium aquaticum]KUJ55308.1 hypothetical protein AR686_13635 [Chryseobacterium aquaticum subsp. greenlandense]